MAYVTHFIFSLNQFQMIGRRRQLLLEIESTDFTMRLMLSDERKFQFNFSILGAHYFDFVCYIRIGNSFFFFQNANY